VAASSYLHHLSAKVKTMWAITSYYNPMRYKRRLENYRIFRKNLTIPLLAVELSFDGKFELTEGDADILIQISGGAILWQKERLLNLAIKSVPSDVSIIACLDCDLIFERSDWVDESKKQIEDLNVVQPFSNVLDLDREDHEISMAHRYAPPSLQGVVSSVGQTKLAPAVLLGTQTRFRGGGLAWVVRREILENHGLYDAMIAGGGDRAIVSAIYGQFETLIKLNQLNRARREHYLAWAQPYCRAVGERIGHITGRLYHLWHGDIENRNYAGRHRGLAECNFDPEIDIAVGSNGAWQWKRSRPDLEEFCTNYFMGRAEDG
jgi:hypothetical protein